MIVLVARFAVLIVETVGGTMVGYDEGVKGDAM
jgi:hypothetical protein